MSWITVTFQMCCDGLDKRCTKTRNNQHFCVQPLWTKPPVKQWAFCLCNTHSQQESYKGMLHLHVLFWHTAEMTRNYGRSVLLHNHHTNSMLCPSVCMHQHTSVFISTCQNCSPASFFRDPYESTSLAAGSRWETTSSLPRWSCCQHSRLYTASSCFSPSTVRQQRQRSRLMQYGCKWCWGAPAGKNTRFKILHRKGERIIILLVTWRKLYTCTFNSEMQHWVPGWVVPDISKPCSAFKASDTACPVTKHHIQEVIYLQQQCCENLKPQRFLPSPPVLFVTYGLTHPCLLLSKQP